MPQHRYEPGQTSGSLKQTGRSHALCAARLRWSWRMVTRLGVVALASGLWVSSVVPEASAQQPAKQQFGRVPGPAQLAARSIGAYSRGCLAGGQALSVTGPNWQAMRLSRNRNWGHPVLIAYLEQLAKDAAAQDGWPGLLVGDLSQPAGGPMLTGHRSHQIGLDADIWLTPMPNRVLTNREREDISAISMLRTNTMQVDPNKWSMAHARVIRRAAQYPEVARIFVHPGIKKAMCDIAWNDDRQWLRKVRPWWGHHYHFHVRLTCPPGLQGCTNQNPPPAGDGCGSELASWFAPPDPNAKPTPRRQRRELTLGDLPVDCGQVLQSAGYRGPAATPGGGDPSVLNRPLNLPNQAPLPRRRPER